MLYELINPSDAYTFRAPSIEVAGVCAAFLSTAYGARQLGGNSTETTPILLGWNEWLEDRGINDAWIDSHASEISEAYASFMIGDYAQRSEIESLLQMVPEEQRQKWLNERQEKKRSSLNKIGERAYQLAAHFKKIAAFKWRGE